MDQVNRKKKVCMDNILKRHAMDVGGISTTKYLTRKGIKENEICYSHAYLFSPCKSPFFVSGQKLKLKTLFLAL